MFKKFFAIVLCSVLTTGLLGGCGEEKESSQEDYYGQALKEVNGKEIYMIYDGRYVEDEEMDVLAKYYDSIQKKDYEAFKTTQSEEYLKFLEEKQTTDISSYVDETYTEFETDLGTGFDFSQIEVVDCGDSTIDNGINDIKDLLDGIYEDNGEEKSFSDTVKDAKYVKFDVTATGSNEVNYTLSDEIRYIFNCEDGIYIF